MADVDKLVTEALENSRGDRKVLEEVRDRLITLIENGGQPQPRPQSEDEEDPRNQEQFAVVAVSENIVSITEALTRVNLQLVELAKIRVRQTMKKGASGDSDDLYDLIEKDLDRAG